MNKNQTYLSIDEIKKLYPDEWVLLANPEIMNTVVLGGIVLYHSKDKKEVCYLGKDKTENYDSLTIAFAGDIKQYRKVGILKRVNSI